MEKSVAKKKCYVKPLVRKRDHLKIVTEGGAVPTTGVMAKPL